MCDCDKLKNLKDVSEYFYYDWLEEDIQTNAFTRYTDRFKIMCIKHHPFFSYLAGINHITPNLVNENILHAWYSKVSRELKILGHRNDDIGIGLNKAWNLFWDDKNLFTRTYTLGDDGIIEYTIYYNIDNIIGENTFKGNIYVGLLCNDFNKNKNKK